MGNEQSSEGGAVPEMGLRLSTLCRYKCDTGNEEGMTFPWFQASTNVSGLALKGAHRWGYVLSYAGGQRVFKDTRQRFFVLLGHYLCFFEAHTPDARMRGNIDLDKALCNLELLPHSTDGLGSIGPGQAEVEDGEHRLEITRRADGWSMVLCFSNVNDLQQWMMSIFDVQQRKATFSALQHDVSAKRDGVDNEPLSSLGDDRNRRGQSGEDWVEIDLAQRHCSIGRAEGLADRSRDGSNHTRRRLRRGTLSSRSPSERDNVPLFWANERSHDDDVPASSSLAKASDVLAGLPRGGRAAGEGMSTDEYGAFTTAQADIYEGWTRNLQRHGWGRTIRASGDRIEGWWEHDVLEGSGEHTCREEGWTYRGGYVAGEQHGPGRLTTSRGDAWDCEWRHGVVASRSSATHTTKGGELYQGACAPCPENPRVPCRSGHGRLRWKDGDHVETHFRAGLAVDGAKGVVRFRNGAIFFGELQGARPHGYGELYLSSVKRERKVRPLPELDAMAQDILWYKGDFCNGQPHGAGLVKYKQPPSRTARSYSPRVTSRLLPLPGQAISGNRGSAIPEDESKAERVHDAAARSMRAVVSRDMIPEDDEKEDEVDGEGDTESEEDEEDEDDDDDDDSSSAQQGGRSGGMLNAGGQVANGFMRSRQRPPDGNEVDLSGSGVDMEYEAEFIEGVMIKHDTSRLRLAALRFGRAEVRALGTLLRQEEEAMARMRSRGLCLLCNIEEMNALLVACRHRVLCMGCAARAESCPVCRARIGKVVKTYTT